MSGFKNFLLRGNLVEMAVGVIVALSFNTVVEAFTAWLTSLIPGTDDFFGTSLFGTFLNALISFVILAAVVYFFVVLPYTKAKERFFPSDPEEEAAVEVDLLAEIRDLLKTRNV